MRVVPAQEILDKIERGEPVEYDHVIVEGDLDLRKLDLPKRRVNWTPFEIEWLDLSENAMIVSSSIWLNDSTIDGAVYFNNTIFLNPIMFWNSNFEGVACFRGSAFRKDALFSRSAFNDAADFSSSCFECIAYFGGSDFSGAAHFGGSNFKRDAHFGNSAFEGNAYFGNAAFKGDANFYGATFNGDAYFERTHFNDVQITSAIFNKLAFIGGARFNGTASFNSTRFKEDASFEGADFNGTLYLDRAKYDKLYISWKNIKELGYDDAAYLALLENFKKLGYFEDYDACYYDYRQQHRDQDWSGGYHAMHPAEEWARKRIDALLDVFYGYGKKPLWPLLWSAGTILIFGIIWLVSGMNGLRGKNGRSIFERFGLQNATAKTRHRDWWGGARAFSDALLFTDSLLFSATVFLSGTRLFVEPPEQPEMRRLSANQVKWAMIFERVLGALFSILFFLAISGTVVR